MAKAERVPGYCRHKATGQAYCRLNGRDHYLGVYNTPESRERYNRLIAEWLAGGRGAAPLKGPGLTVSEALDAYWVHARGWYQKGGKPTSQTERVRVALAPARDLYGSTPARDFGPGALKAVRGVFVTRGYARRYANQLTDCLKRAFKWLVSEELVPPAVYEGLRAVEGLRKGRTEAPDRPEVPPAPESAVAAFLANARRELAGMAAFQRHTGCRPGEVCSLRACELERTHLPQWQVDGRRAEDGTRPQVSSPVWLYRPASHKTEHHGRARVIPVGPRAQETLLGFLRVRCPHCATEDRPYRVGWRSGLCGPCADRSDEAGLCGPWPHAAADDSRPVFSPQEERRDRHAAMRAARRTPVQPSQADRSRERPKRPPGECYTSQSYAHAVARECERHGIEAFAPNSLRHARATEVRAAYGVEGAQHVLGHARVEITEIYALKSLELAARIAAETG